MKIEIEFHTLRVRAGTTCCLASMFSLNVLIMNDKNLPRNHVCLVLVSYILRTTLYFFKSVRRDLTEWDSQPTSCWLGVHLQVLLFLVHCIKYNYWNIGQNTFLYISSSLFYITIHPLGRGVIHKLPIWSGEKEDIVREPGEMSSGIYSGFLQFEFKSRCFLSGSVEKSGILPCTRS